MATHGNGGSSLRHNEENVHVRNSNPSPWLAIYSNECSRVLLLSLQNPAVVLRLNVNARS